MNDLNIIKNKIKEFEDFKNSLDRQQLTYPLDIISSDIVSDKVIIDTGETVFPVNLATPFDEATEIVTNNKKYLLESTSFVQI